MSILEEIIRETKILEQRLVYLKELAKLYSGTNSVTPINVGTDEIVLDILSQLGKSDISTIADRMDKSTKTIDNILRRLYKEEKVDMTKEGKKAIYSIKK